MSARVSSFKTRLQLLLYVLANDGNGGDAVQELRFFHQPDVVSGLGWLPAIVDSRRFYVKRSQMVLMYLLLEDMNCSKPRHDYSGAVKFVLIALHGFVNECSRIVVFHLGQQRSKVSRY